MTQYKELLNLLDELGSFWSGFENRNELASLFSGISDIRDELDARMTNFRNIIGITNTVPYFKSEFVLVDPLKWEYADGSVTYNYSDKLVSAQYYTNSIDDETVINVKYDNIRGKDLFKRPLTTSISDVVLGTEDNPSQALLSESGSALRLFDTSHLTGSNLIVMNVSDFVTQYQAHEIDGKIGVGTNTLPLVGYVYTNTGQAIKYSKIDDNTLSIDSKTKSKVTVYMTFDGYSNSFVNLPKLLPYKGKLTTADGTITYRGLNYKTGLLENLEFDYTPEIGTRTVATYTPDGYSDIYFLNNGDHYFNNIVEINDDFYKFWGAILDPETKDDLIDFYKIEDIIHIVNYIVSVYKKTISVSKLGRLLNLLHNVPFSREAEVDEVTAIDGTSLKTKRGQLYIKHPNVNWNRSVGDVINKYDLLTDSQIIVIDNNSNTHLNAGLKFAGEIALHKPNNFDEVYIFNETFIQNILDKVTPGSIRLSTTSHTQAEVLYEGRFTNIPQAAYERFTKTIPNLNLTSNYTFTCAIDVVDKSIDTEIFSTDTIDIANYGLEVKLKDGNLDIYLRKPTLNPTPMFASIPVENGKCHFTLVWRTADQKFDIYYNGLLHSTATNRSFQYYSQGEKIKLNTDLNLVDSNVKFLFFTHSNIPLTRERAKRYGKFFEHVYGITTTLTMEGVNYNFLGADTDVRIGTLPVGAGYYENNLTTLWNKSITDLRGITHSSSVSDFRFPIQLFTEDNTKLKKYFFTLKKDLDATQYKPLLLFNSGSTNSFIMALETGVPKLYRVQSIYNYYTDSAVAVDSINSASNSSSVIDDLGSSMIVKLHWSDSSTFVVSVSIDTATTEYVFTPNDFTIELNDINLVPNHISELYIASQDAVIAQDTNTLIKSYLTAIKI
jgi:hypothetical protein